MKAASLTIKTGRQNRGRFGGPIWRWVFWPVFFSLRFVIVTFMNKKRRLVFGLFLAACLTAGYAGPLCAQGNLVKQGLKRAASSGVKEEARAAGLAAPSASGQLYRSLEESSAGGMPERMKRSLYGAAVKAGADRRATLQFLYKLGAHPGKKYIGYTADVRRTLDELQARFEVASRDEVFEKLAAQAESFYPPALMREPVVFRGLFIQEPQEVARLLLDGMPASRVTQKTPAVAGPDAGLIANREFSSLCFGRSASESVPYAFGQGIGYRAERGFMTLAVLKKPSDLNTSGVWTLARDVAPEEILDVLLYDARAGRWLSLRGSAELAARSK